MAGNIAESGAAEEAALIVGARRPRPHAPSHSEVDALRWLYI